MPRTLGPARAKAFYDRFGSKQDAQGFYEDRALALLVANAELGTARRLLELGCGTGRLARSLLERSLGSGAAYCGLDLSTTMVRLARDRLRPFAGRALVAQAVAGPRLPVADGAVDRFLSTYVLDLLAPDTIAEVLREAHRVLAPGGRLGLVGITRGRTPGSRLVMSGWSLVHRVAPALVGGCRPLSLPPFLDGASWRLDFHRVVSSYGIASEVLVATRRSAGGAAPASGA